MALVRQIIIEAEAPGDSRTMFRLRIDAKLIAENPDGGAGAYSCRGNSRANRAAKGALGQRPRSGSQSDPAVTARAVTGVGWRRYWRAQ